MSESTPNETVAQDAVETEAVTYNEFAAKLVEGLQTLNYTFKDSDGRTEIWTNKSQSRTAEISVDWVAGKAIVEVTAHHGKRLVKQQTIYLKSSDDLYRVIRFAG